MSDYLNRSPTLYVKSTLNYNGEIVMATYVTSDWHFYHKKMLDGTIETRPPEYMSILLHNYDKVVCLMDTVYFLGDMCFQPFLYKEVFARTMRELKGDKHLVRGNHDDFKRFPDTFWLEDCGFTSVSTTYIILGRYLLSHFPMIPVDARFSMETNTIKNTFDSDPSILYNVHGHTHSKAIADGRLICACPEQTDYSPVELSNALLYTDT